MRAEKVKVDYESAHTAVVDPAKAQAQGAPQIHPDIAQHDLSVESGRPESHRVRLRRRQACTKLDIINNRLVPNAMEPRAALAEYDEGADHLTLWNTSQNPHVARLVIAAICRHGEDILAL